MYNPNILYSHLIKNFGIGQTIALKMCHIMNVSPLRPFNDMYHKKLTKGYNFLKQNKYSINYKLKDDILDFLLYNGQIQNIKSFKYSKFLPIRGQKNKSNAKTAKKQAIINNKLLIERNKITKVIKIIEKKRKFKRR